MRNTLQEKYGEEVLNKFFKPKNIREKRNSTYTSNSFDLDDDDDDDWFKNDEEILNLQEIGILIEGFEEAFKDMDNEQASWGTGGKTLMSGFTSKNTGESGNKNKKRVKKTSLT